MLTANVTFCHVSPIVAARPPVPSSCARQRGFPTWQGLLQLTQGDRKMPSQISTRGLRSRTGFRYGLTLGMTLPMSTLLAGCWPFGSSNNNDEDEGPPAITVSIAPANPSVQTGNSLQFTATVANSGNTAVTLQGD